MSALNNLLANIKLITGTTFNADEVITDMGSEERAVKAMVQTYCQVCRIHSQAIRMISGAEDLINKNIAGFNQASQWD
jgi:hypothetical protein